jgi:hypothetical protein
VLVPETGVVLDDIELLEDRVFVTDESMLEVVVELGEFVEEEVKVLEEVEIEAEPGSITDTVFEPAFVTYTYPFDESKATPYGSNPTFTPARY